jgi:hypothetical protein
MAFSLIDHDAGAVPLVAVSKAGLAAWREAAPAAERDWVAATGFGAEAGKLALIPDDKGRLGRVLVGLPEGEAAMWALAGLSDALPEGSYRIAEMPEGGDPTRIALGWALGTYAFTRYREPKKPSGARLVWPKRADRAQVEHLAGAVFLARDLINTPASDMGPAELAAAAIQVAEKADAQHRVITGDALLAENYPTIHAVGEATFEFSRGSFQVVSPFANHADVVVRHQIFRRQGGGKLEVLQRRVEFSAVKQREREAVMRGVVIGIDFQTAPIRPNRFGHAPAMVPSHAKIVKAEYERGSAGHRFLVVFEGQI